MKPLKLFVLKLAETVVLPFSFIAFCIYFPLKCFKHLYGAEVVVLPEKLNFGATIFLSDIARRMYSGRKTVFMVFQNFSHNPLLSEIWRGSENFEYVSISRCGFHRRVWGRKISLPDRKVFDPLAIRLVGWVAHLLGQDPLIMLNSASAVSREGGQSMRDLLSYVEVPETWRVQIADALEKSPGNGVVETWSTLMPYCSLYHMRREIPMPDPTIPIHMRDEMERALVAVRGGREDIRLCGLYMKRILYKIAPLPEKQLKWWDGSDFESYLPAVRLLANRGYQVLLTGDLEIPTEVAEEFGGLFVDARILGVDANLFRLYAALHTDAFIADCGGGWLLGGLVADRDALVVNAFPFHTSCGTQTGKHWLYYKHAYDTQGNHVPFRDIVQKYPFACKQFEDRQQHGHAHPFEHHYLPDGYDVLPNTADEILEAVHYYVEEIERPGSSKVDADLENTWPEYSLFKISGAHISPAFVTNYYEKYEKMDVA